MIEIMVRHYLIAALWASTDNAGNPLDDTCDDSDWHPSAIARANADCAAFIAQAQQLLPYLPDSYGAHPDCGRVHPAYAALGHDLWLTRNHHGAGFWDRGLGAVGEKLTGLAHEMGECDAYIGNDCFIYLG
jgi:hypothetical protein